MEDADVRISRKLYWELEAMNQLALWEVIFVGTGWVSSFTSLLGLTEDHILKLPILLSLFYFMSLAGAASILTLGLARVARLEFGNGHVCLANTLLILALCFFLVSGGVAIFAGQSLIGSACLAGKQATVGLWACGGQ